MDFKDVLFVRLKKKKNFKTIIFYGIFGNPIEVHGFSSFFHINGGVLAVEFVFVWYLWGTHTAVEEKMIRAIATWRPKTFPCEAGAGGIQISPDQ